MRGHFKVFFTDVTIINHDEENLRSHPAVRYKQMKTNTNQLMMNGLMLFDDSDLDVASGTADSESSCKEVHPVKENWLGG